MSAVAACLVDEKINQAEMAARLMKISRFNASAIRSLRNGLRPDDLCLEALADFADTYPHAAIAGAQDWQVETAGAP